MADYTLHESLNDLPATATFPGGMAAVDTETTGLDVRTERLCLVQVSDGLGNVWLVRFDGTDNSAPNLRKMLEDPRITKLFHFARFDLAILSRVLNVPDIGPFFCTKIASKLLRQNGARHNLRTLVSDYLGVTLDKTEQLSDWTVPELSESQKRYAASDVLYLHDLFGKMTAELAEKGLTQAMDQALRFLATRVWLDLEGHPETDLFAHK